MITSQSERYRQIRLEALAFLVLILLDSTLALVLVISQRHKYDESVKTNLDPDGTNAVTEERLAGVIKVVLDTAIHGQWPFLESVQERHDRYMTQHHQDPDKAVHALVKK